MAGRRKDKTCRLIVLALAATAGAGAQQPQAPAIAPVQQKVQVTSTRSESPVGETARTSFELNAVDLRQYPAITLDESLRQHAGFELFRRSSSRVQNPTSAGISLRGLGSTAASRTLVLQDGAPLNDPFGGWIHWNENPTGSIERVELVSGGGSDLYGSSALGGVIDVVPAAPTPGRLDFLASGGGQSTSDIASTAVGTSSKIGGLLAGEALRAGGYQLVDPASAGLVDVPATDASQAYHAEIGRRLLADPRLYLSGNILNETRGNGTPVQTNATRLWRYLGGYDLPERGLTSGRLRVFGSDEGYRQSFSSIAADRNSEKLSRLQRVRVQELGATADATLHFSRFATVFGADLRDLRATDLERPVSRNLPTGFVDTTARQRYAGAFGEMLGTYRHWSGTASLRADRASNLDTVQATLVNGISKIILPPDRTEIVLSPRVGVVRAIDAGFSFHATAFRAFRSPSMNELYRTGQVGQETTLANAALQSERATGWEAGAESGRLPGNSSFLVTYFWTEINRPVSAVLLSRTATTATNQRENLGQIRSRGVETSLSVHAGRGISARLGYQFADATVTRFQVQPQLVGKRIPQVPAHSATAQLRAENARFGELMVAARYGSKAFDDSSNIFPLNQFFDLDLEGSHTFSKRFQVFFAVQNVTNQRAEVARTPILTLGSPIFAQAGVRVHLLRTVVAQP